MLKRIIFVITFLLLIKIQSVFPQNSKWNIFTDMKDVASIAMSKTGQIAYCASSGGLYSVDVSSGEILSQFTLINGLISNEITVLEIDTLNRLWIGALDGSIAIYDISNKSWKYIYDIKNSNESNKSINAFALYKNYIFVGTGYGIQKISFSNFNFVDAPYYQLGVFSIKTKVLSLAINNNTLFAGTASGMAYAPLNFNLNNPASWTNYAYSPLNTSVVALTAYDNKIFAGTANGLAYFDSGNWQWYPNTISTSGITDLKGNGDTLYILINSVVFKAPKTNYPDVTIAINIGQNYNKLSFDNSAQIILGCVEKGLQIKKQNLYFYAYPNGPFRNSCYYITEDDLGNIWVAGGRSDAGFYKYDGTVWATYTKELVPEIGTNNDFRCIVPQGNKIWALSYGGGITKIDGSFIKNYSPLNSNLPGIPNAPNYCVPVGGAVDNNGNFWASFYVQSSGSSLYQFTGNDSMWTPYSNPSIITSANLEHIAIDNYNTKWCVSGELPPRGLYFFNEGYTINNGMYITGDFGVEDITDVIVDRNGEVWIATNNGVYIISKPLEAIQDPSKKPAPVKLGIISGNLRVPFTENSRCITVDILNHKWIGTESNGVFHLSEDGSTLIEQFNIANSPIVDNKISSIVISSKTGKAYFSTLKGISSFQTTAIKPLLEFDKIICSPNPYLVPSAVNLRIDGLVENSFVKIISLTGELIAEFETPGGRIAEWNGVDKKGNLVPSGIYIIVAYNKDGSKVGKGKVAIIRK